MMIRSSISLAGRPAGRKVVAAYYCKPMAWQAAGRRCRIILHCAQIAVSALVFVFVLAGHVYALHTLVCHDLQFIISWLIQE